MMVFQRFWSLRASRLFSKRLGVVRWSAICVFFLLAASTASAFAQYRTLGSRRALNGDRVESIGVPARTAPSENGGGSLPIGNVPVGGGSLPTGNVQVGGVPARIETAPNGVGVGGSNSSKTRTSVAPQNGGVRAALGTQNVRSQNATARTAPVDSSVATGVAASFSIERKATRREAEEIPVPENGYLATIPRSYFSTNSENVDERGLEGVERSQGVDARLQPNADATNSGESTSDAATETADEETIVFALSGLASDETRLLRDSEDGRWDAIDLLDAALIAEGLTTRERRAPYRAKFERFVDQLSAQTKNCVDPLKKTETVYEFLHKNVLTSQYDLNCSSLVASFDSGVFNCVSATVLFNCLAQRVGLDVAALETTGHAKSRVKFDDSYLDLETTCSSWERLPDKVRVYARSVAVARPVREVDSGNENGAENPAFALENAIVRANSNAPVDLATFVERKNERDALSKIRAGATTTTSGASGSNGSNGESFGIDGANGRPENVAARISEEGSTTFDPNAADRGAPVGYSFTRTRRPMREIGEVELIATIYYNVGVDYYQQERFEEAIDAYIKAARLAPNNRNILGNLKATLNNWAIKIAMKEKDYERAIQITEQGMLLDSEFSEYKLNLPVFFQYWTTYLAKDNKWDEVARVEKEYLKRFPKTTVR